MEIYLIRHTTPDIQKGLCYGQSDLDVTGSFWEEADAIQKALPPYIQSVYSSPLQRCSKLAQHLFPQQAIRFDDRLKEINCGEWEMQLWDEIESDILQQWMNDFVNVCIPGGESYVDVHKRVVSFFDELPKESPTAIVAHGGVLRSLLSHINGVDLQESFQTYAIRYGCVIRLHLQEGKLQHHILHNPFSDQEQHRPSKEAVE
jgi:alpha-ribazole phosphatase